MAATRGKNSGGARRRETARLVWNTKPKRAPNPKDLEFQPAEVVFPNKAVEKNELLFPRTPEGEVDDRQMNRLIWGDNLLAMQALLAQGYAGQIDLIYIDPPFLSSSDYSHKMKLGDAGKVTRSPSIIERLAYKDTWRDGIDSYLDMLYPRLQLMRELLSEKGSIYVHIGPNVAAYVRVMMDEIFGRDNMRGEIIWKRSTAHSDTKQGQRQPGRVHDVILFYTKGTDWTWNPQYLPYDQSYVESHYRYAEGPQGDHVTLAPGDPLPKGYRRFRKGDLTAAKPGGDTSYEWKGVKPYEGRYWAYSREKMEEMEAEGRLVYTSTGMPEYKRYLDEMPGVALQDVWTDVDPVNSQAREDTGFDTQKPSALLQRVIEASSNPGDLVADFFHGSGTTANVAENLGRRWIVTDISKVGVQITRSRLVEEGAKPFVLENIGNYQRELIYREGGNIGLMQRIVMKLFGAEPHPAHSDLGIMDEKGRKVLVYVGYPDRPLTARKTAELVKQAHSLDGGGYDNLVLLAWDYEYNYDEQLEHRKKGFGVHVEPRLIPPSIYEYLRKSKDVEDLTEKFSEKVRFGAKPYLKLKRPEAKPWEGEEFNVAVAIERYVLSEIPLDNDKERAEVQRISHGEKFPVLIDYWAVDWDYDGRTFRSKWQDFRGNGKRPRVVGTRANATLRGGRKYDIAVRVVDVFGNDATATTQVDLR